MRPVSLVPLPGGATAEQKLAWCIDAIQKIALASRTDDPNKAADEFTVTNGSEQRTLDVGSGTLADVRAVLGTFLTTLQKRGSRRS